MVTERQRKLTIFLEKNGLWEVDNWMRIPWLRTRRPFFDWLLKKIKKAQAVDDLHHAPACPANHYHKQRLVFSGCTCGAAIRNHDKQ